MGEAPWWYRVVRAAKFLGVAPWDLAEAPITWLHRAEATMEAEHAAQEAERRRQAGRR